MKILFFMDVFIFGGCEKMLKEVTDSLIKDSYDVELLLIYRSKSNTYLKMLNEKIKVHYLWDIDDKSYFSKRAIFWKNVLSPKTVLKRFNFTEYDCVINFKDDLQTNILSSKINRPKIAWVHNITEKSFSNKNKGLKYKLANIAYGIIYKKYFDSFSKFNKVIFVSNHALDSLLYHIKKPINSIVIYNYVNNDEIIKKSNEEIKENVFSADNLPT